MKKKAPPKPNEPSEVAARIGACIRKHRERAGMTQDELARRCSVSRATINGIECGRSMPKLVTLLGMSQALGVQASRVMQGDA